MVRNMAKNLGKLQLKPVTIPAINFFQTDEQIEAGEPELVMIPPRIFYKQFTADDVPWNEASKGLEGPSTWFIAVREDGWIFSAEQDPTMIGLSDVDIWQIEHPGPQAAIIAHHWNGKEVVDDIDQP